jgi:outer membrane protein OmpA-like peptidoglycan-associated protein
MYKSKQHCLKGIIGVLFLLNSVSLFSQIRPQYADTLIDAYNTVTKSKDQFFGGYGLVNGHKVYLTSLLHRTDTFVSLPLGSYVILGFKDNYIIDAPDKPDIYLEEDGGAGDFADVFVSSDNVEYTYLGKAGNGKVNKMDLASIGYTKPVYYIKVVGLDANGESPGFDLRNLCGLPGANQIKPKTFEPIFFETNSSVLSDSSRSTLNKLAGTLNADLTIRVEIRGHTDNVGNNAQNQMLSEKRAMAAMHYLETLGIPKERMTISGMASSKPLASNIDESGRSQNRRVEFVLVK